MSAGGGTRRRWKESEMRVEKEHARLVRLGQMTFWEVIGEKIVGVLVWCIRESCPRIWMVYLAKRGDNNPWAILRLRYGLRGHIEGAPHPELRHSPFFSRKADLREGLRDGREGLEACSAFDSSSRPEDVPTAVTVCYDGRWTSTGRTVRPRACRQRRGSSPWAVTPCAASTCCMPSHNRGAA
jgi:hypothetical protein